MEEAIDILVKYKKPVWKEIEKYLTDPIYPKPFIVPSKYKRLSDFHWEIVSEYPRRQGKYLRPTILILTGLAMGADLKKLVKTAAAMQISEDWLLIHDDFEDGSIARRGGPTLHLKYGPELAVNAGDTLQTIMWKVISDNRRILGEAKTLRIIDEFYKMLLRTSMGQTIEIKWTKENRSNLSDKDWFFVADGKTSYYTIAHPMRLGAIIAGADEKKLDSISKFSLHLGRCFQLVDDVLDVTSDFQGQKKQKGNDILEGKRTLLLGHLLRKANKTDKKKVNRILLKDRDEKTQEEVNWVIEKMRDYGSINYARRVATRLNKKAMQIFNNDLRFLDNSKARSELTALVKFILERDH